MNAHRPRRHLSDAGCFASDAELEKLASIEISGSDGRDGRDGQSFFHPPPGRGRPGRRGGDATPASDGQAGGNLLLTLSYDGGDREGGCLYLQGPVEVPGQPSMGVVQSLPIGTSGYVFINAIGGKGGNGGRGGQGQPGSVGARGANATRYSHGRNGGPGGNGGNAGNPTDGASGGTGGSVSLTVAQKDLGLLMLVKGHLAGGDIGFAGEPGRGGKGGPGGAGGSSYHWTESRSYTDAQGRRRTRTTFHSNPGGRKGRPGRNGFPSQYRAKDGTPGEPGLLQINVVTAGNQRLIYAAPYDLELVTFDITSEYETLEPDSLVSVDKMVIRNRGGMPTPENYTVRIFIESDRWVVSEQVDLVLHRSLAPGETFCFEDHGLRFRIGDYVVETPRRRPFRAKHMVSPQAMMESGIHRPFRQFENGEHVPIRFPVELMAITSLNSLAPGESTRVIWGVTNVGNETFDHRYLFRAVKTQLQWLAGDVNPEDLVFFDDADQLMNLVGTRYQKDIDEFLPGETRVIETRVGIRHDANVKPYQGFGVMVGVELQRPGTSAHRDSYRQVDARKSFIRISERYARQEESRFLLIANQKTTVNDIEKWTQLADYFGSGLDVWDVSYYGFFDLMRAVDRDRSLLQQWKGMTVIVPNNNYETPNGKTAAFEQLAKSQFLKAAADYDINFYVVGDSRTGGAGMLQNALIPVGSEKSPSELKTEKAFLREVNRWAKYVERSQDVVGGATSGVREFADVSLGACHDLEIEKRTFLFQPDRTWLEQHAKNLQAKLRKVDPLHRWIIVHRYDSEDTDTSWGFFRKRKVGKLEIRRTLDSTKGSAVLYEVDSIDAIDEDFITSKENKHGIFLALKFEDKVDRFIRLVSERTFPRYAEKYIDRPLTDEEVLQIGRELVDSILTDLFNEQRVARNSKTWGRSRVRVQTPKLNYLAERSLNYGVTYRQMQENAASLEMLYELIANIRHMARRSQSIWDSSWIPTSIFKRSRAVSAHMLERADRIVTNIFGRRLGWWDRITAPNDQYDAFGNARTEDPQGIERTLADQRIAEIEAQLDRRNPAIEKYTTAQDHRGLTYDPELLSAESRVMSGETFDQLVAMEAQAGERRIETERAVKAKRADLLVPLSREQATPIATPQSMARPTQ